MNNAVRMELNQELNGVELYFDSKPVQQIIDTLKANKFRWSGFKSCWYAKQNEKTLKLAQEMTSTTIEQQTAEQTETAPKSNITKIHNKNILPLFERVQFTPGNADTSKYKYKFVGSNYTGLTTKETAKEIRSHLKARFPEVKFSITSDYSRIDITIKQSPYNNLKLEYSANIEPRKYREYDAEHNKEINAIVEYCNRLLTSYNYDDSDIMTDYFHTHFYKNVSVDYEYIQTEQTDTIKTDIQYFRQKLEQQAKEEEEQKEREYQEHLKQIEKDKIEYEVRRKEEEKQREIINNSINSKTLEESEQYFIIGSQFAKLNKNNTLEEYKEEVSKGEFYPENVKILKDVHFTSMKALEYFSNMLLHDFDFLDQIGGSYTDDVRINSMTDYHQMDKEERETVIWNTYGVAIYYNNELQFIANTEGSSYARYVGLVNDVKIQKELNVKQFINPAQLEELKQQAETITDISFNVITENNIKDTWNNENWKTYKEAMKEQLKQSKVRLTKAIIQQIDGDMDSLKVAMYKLLTEVDGIQEQFKNADIKQGQKVTLINMSDFGSIVTKRVIIDSVENTKYAQYDNAVKLTFKPENKRKLYYNYYYGTLLVYNGWLNLPEEVLFTIEKKTDFTVTRSKYLSCDKRQYDEILNYFAEQGIKPIVNTYKPVF